jgi:hypothetical protein
MAECKPRRLSDILGVDPNAWGKGSPMRVRVQITTDDGSVPSGDLLDGLQSELEAQLPGGVARVLFLPEAAATRIGAEAVPVLEVALGAGSAFAVSLAKVLSTWLVNRNKSEISLTLTTELGDQTIEAKGLTPDQAAAMVHKALEGTGGKAAAQSLTQSAADPTPQIQA